MATNDVSLLLFMHGLEFFRVSEAKIVNFYTIYGPIVAAGSCASSCAGRCLNVFVPSPTTIDNSPTRRRRNNAIKVHFPRAIRAILTHFSDKIDSRETELLFVVFSFFSSSFGWDSIIVCAVHNLRCDFATLECLVPINQN